VSDFFVHSFSFYAAQRLNQAADASIPVAARLKEGLGVTLWEGDT
jgi:hypothetical protein